MYKGFNHVLVILVNWSPALNFGVRGPDLALPGALCCVYWLLTNQHDNFIRGQPPDRQLSRQSWAWIQAGKSWAKLGTI